MKRVNKVLLEFDMDNIPKGDVASGEWLDNIYDAFMRQDFSTLPEGVNHVEYIFRKVKQVRVVKHE